jgi:hypothetical protein
MNNPEEIKMGIEAAGGFNPNIPQSKSVTNNQNIANADKKGIVPNADGVNNDPQLNLENTVSVNFNATKTSAKELRSVNIFEQESLGKVAMKSAADSIDLVNGPLKVIGQDLLNQFRAV